MCIGGYPIGGYASTHLADGPVPCPYRTVHQAGGSNGPSVDTTPFGKATEGAEMTVVMEDDGAATAEAHSAGAAEAHAEHAADTADDAVETAEAAEDTAEAALETASVAVGVAVETAVETDTRLATLEGMVMARFDRQDEALLALGAGIAAKLDELGKPAPVEPPAPPRDTPPKRKPLLHRELKFGKGKRA